MTTETAVSQIKPELQGAKLLNEFNRTSCYLESADNFYERTVYSPTDQELDAQELLTELETALLAKEPSLEKIVNLIYNHKNLIVAKTEVRGNREIPWHESEVMLRLGLIAIELAETPRNYVAGWAKHKEWTPELAKTLGRKSELCKLLTNKAYQVVIALVSRCSEEICLDNTMARFETQTEAKKWFTDPIFCRLLRFFAIVDNHSFEAKKPLVVWLEKCSDLLERATYVIHELDVRSNPKTRDQEKHSLGFDPETLSHLAQAMVFADMTEKIITNEHIEAIPLLVHTVKDAWSWTTGWLDVIDQHYYHRTESSANHLHCFSDENAYADDDILKITLNIGGDRFGFGCNTEKSLVRRQQRVMSCYATLHALVEKRRLSKAREEIELY